MQCRNCRATWDDASLNFCGRCGQRLRGAATTVSLELPKQTPVPALVTREKEHAQHAKHVTGKRTPRVIYGFVTLLACCVLFAGLFTFLSQVKARPVATPSQRSTPAPVLTHAPRGSVWFTDVYAQGDGVVMHLSNLPPLTKGHIYAGWLLNAYRPDLLFALGPLTPDKNGVVSFDSSQLPTFNLSRQNLRLAFTRVAVTLESSPLSLLPTQRPLGPTVLRGMMQIQALDALTPLFVSTTYLPGKSSLIAGMRSQLREVVRWVANMLDSAPHGDSGAVQADLLRLVYVIEGSQGVDSVSLQVSTMSNIQNEGDGFGLLAATPNCQPRQASCGYFEAIRSVLQSLVATNAISTQDVQQALTALTTAEQLTKTILHHVLQLIGAPTLDAATRTSFTLLGAQSDALLNGSDRDGDGSIDPIPGEASVAQLYTYLQTVGTIKLA